MQKEKQYRDMQYHFVPVPDFLSIELFLHISTLILDSTLQHRTV